MTRFEKSQIYDVSKTTEGPPTANCTVPASTLYHVTDASTLIFIDIYINIYYLIILRILHFNDFILLYIVPWPTIILQPLASIQPDFPISYCNKHCKPVATHRVKPCGEYKCIAFYIILKQRAYGPIMVVNGRNMYLFLNKKQLCSTAQQTICFWIWYRGFTCLVSRRNLILVPIGLNDNYFC
jgi:hypothetical protein